jgi:hypothetical protein
MYLPFYAIPVVVGQPWSSAAALAGVLAAFGLACAVSLALLAIRHRLPDPLPFGRLGLARPMKERSAI